MNPAQEILLLPLPRTLERKNGNCAQTKPIVSIDPSLAKPQGYRLSITPQDIRIRGHDPAGAFYGEQTFKQLSRQFGKNVPCMEIEDWPDFPVRGVVLDISRDKVPTMQTLYALLDELAQMKVNQLQLYTEHTFAYSQHQQVWEHSSPMSTHEVRDLDRYCRKLFIDLVPNQNSFGHMERWLKFDRYKPLAEAPNGFTMPWGMFWDGPFSLCPSDPRSIELLRGLYDELLPNFSSSLFNVCCDETYDVGQGRSKVEAPKCGAARLYVEFLNKVNDLVKSHRRTMMFWGDIILHNPELIGELPRDVIALEWGYEADHPFDKEGRVLHDAGIPFYVCPGTSSWASIAGRSDNAVANLANAAENGLKHGAIGYLITDWGDYGHLQYQPISYVGFAAGAAYSWCFETNKNIPLRDVLNLHVFRDHAGAMAKVAWDLGNVYQTLKLVGNASSLFRVFIPSSASSSGVEDITRASLDAAQNAIDNAMAPIDSVKMDRPDANLVIDEFKNAAAMLKHACRRGRWLLDCQAEDRGALAAELRRVVAEHRCLWLLRNRPGGLPDSCRRMEEYLPQYIAGTPPPTPKPGGMY